MMGPENIWIIALGGAACLISNVCYMMGGTSGFGKFWRRFIGAFILALAANLIAAYLGKWAWQYLIVFICLAAGFSLPYGVNDGPYQTLRKVAKRTVFALGVLTACVCGLYATGFTVYGWVVIGMAGTASLISIVLGVINPFNSATLEQFLISQVLTMFVIWWPFVR